MSSPDSASTDLDFVSLRDASKGRVVGTEVLYYRTVGSTMDVAKGLAGQGKPEGTVVVVEEQTAGRGRFGRTWVSPPGADLLFSVLLRPTTPQLRWVNMAATMAVSQVAAEITGLAPSIKWPNDVRIRGRKLSGILVETSVGGGKPSHAVVGFGINVNLDPSRYPEIADTATSLFVETGSRVDRTRVLRAVLKALDDLYGEIRGGASLTDRWAPRLDTLGRSVTVRTGDRLIEGTASGVDADGNLLIALPDGSSVTVVAGEVTLQASFSMGTCHRAREKESLTCLPPGPHLK